MCIKPFITRDKLSPLTLIPHSKGHRGSSLNLPSPHLLIRHAIPIVIEAILGQLVVFYVVLMLWGFRPALIASLALTYGLMARRISRRERISTLLILGMLLLTLRTGIAYATKSSFFYFVQPLAGSVVIAGVLIVTALMRRPFTQRFAHDFCPLSPQLLKNPRIWQFFVRVSYLWAATLLINSGVVLWLLLNSSLKSFVLERSGVTWGTTAIAVTLSIVGFIRTLRNDGVAVHWGQRNQQVLA